MTNSRWVNRRWVGRLDVQEIGENLIKFHDMETKEAVLVFIPDALEDIAMAILPPSSAPPVPEEVPQITREDARHLVIGEGVAKRDVWHYVTSERATALRAGLTVHRSAFSSTPHGFELQPEPGFEEVFYFLLPEGGKGALEGQGLWPDGQEVDAIWAVYDRRFAQVPMGWHRVAALPLDASGEIPPLAYIWCYLCTKPEWEKG